jgi:hypothetical protein
VVQEGNAGKGEMAGPDEGIISGLISSSGKTGYRRAETKEKAVF